MKPDEQLVYKYLTNLHLGSVVYEPIKNKPPDFLVNGTIAVEVRRLNQNEITSSGYRGLEETRYPLVQQMVNLLASFGPSETGVSWFVCYRFRRPLPHWKELRPLLRSWLSTFRRNPPPLTEREVSAEISDKLAITLLRAGNSYQSLFIPGSCSDDDTGGWTLGETKKNLALCIEEKTRIVAPYRNEHPEWWLVLVDRIGWGVDECDQNLFREHLKLQHDWNKIVLVSPLDPSRGFELASSIPS